MEAAPSRGGAPRAGPGAAPARGGAAAAAAEDARQSRTWQFTKTKLCKFHIIGMCVKGGQCPFAHEKAELRPLPDLTCTKLCKTLISTGSCEDRNCTYAHTKEELRATSTFHKTKLCRFSQIGHCALGAKCNFAHSPEEVRPLEAPRVQQQQQPRQPATGQESLYSDQQLNEAALLLQQQLALAQQQSDAAGYPAGMANYPLHRPQYLAGLVTPELVAVAAAQDPQWQDAAFRAAVAGAAGAGRQAGGRRDFAASAGAAAAAHPGQGPSADVRPAARGGPFPTGGAVPPQRPAVAGMQQRRRGGRRGREPQHPADRGMGRVGEAEAAETDPSQKALAGAYDGATLPAGVAAAMADGGNSGMGAAIGAMAGMPSLDWIARQGGPMPQMPGTPGMPDASYGGNPAAAFGNAAMQLAANNSSEFRDSPAYVTQMASDFVVKNTFLEFGPIGRPLRPVRSAAGRLDVLGGAEGSEASGLGADEGAGSAGSEFVGGEAAGAGAVAGQVVSRAGMASCYFNDADAAGGASGGELVGGYGVGAAGDMGASGALRSDCTSQASYGGCEGGGMEGWDESLLKGSFTVDQNHDMWQVKNTFLTFSPQTKPIRSIRTAEGALCTLGAIDDDDEP